MGDYVLMERGPAPNKTHKRAAFESCFFRLFRVTKADHLQYEFVSSTVLSYLGAGELIGEGFTLWEGPYSLFQTSVRAIHDGEKRKAVTRNEELVDAKKGEELRKRKQTVKATMHCSDKLHPTPRSDEYSHHHRPNTVQTTTLPDETCVSR